MSSMALRNTAADKLMAAADIPLLPRKSRHWNWRRRKEPNGRKLSASAIAFVPRVRPDVTKPMPLADIGVIGSGGEEKGTKWETKLSASATASVPRVRPVVTNNAVSKLEMSGISLKCLRACNGENSLTLASQAIFLGRLARCVLSSCLPFLERRTAVAQRDVLTTEVGKPNRGC